ncbi:tetratricopeptide repeat-containing protein [Candidatus Chloroploca asiatica]|uniref:Uncharacterized protein n=1 Tax=Candidatus Chloroploca asiatica TaxID=1506545 RepID=A0A2H3KV52_9CHLR|nr:tetratricopeptide repeat-containing protein [Candidatus Chloroploca asiatica]PDV97761.1 hypothetical protein A9Q02_17610 [Candidatus Chloroploca asiatica]
MTGATPMPPTPPADDPLTTQARAGLRRTHWPALLAGAGGAATLGLLGAAGLAPLLAGLGVETLATGPVMAWLTGMGMNALAGWVGTLAADGVQAALAEDEPDPAWVAALGQRLDAAAVSDQALATELARLLRTLDALPQALAAIAEEQGAQSDLLLAQYDLLQQLSADMERLHVSGGALGPVVIAEADRVIAAITARSEARFDEVLAALTALRDTQRQALVDFGSGNQFRDVTMGDVAGGDVNKNAGDVIYGNKVVQPPFTPRPVAATAEELAAAQATLAAMPTTSIPLPQDVLPPGSWLGGLRRNHQFVGREADLLALATLLKGGQSVAVNQGQAAVASGLGGIGKTQLAIEFAARYGQHFAGVFWLSFAQPDTIPTEFARLGGAAHLQIFTEAAGLKLNEQVNLVRSRLACGLPYLLIFDNCEDPQLVRAHHPGGATRVLITSRNPAWPGDLGVQRHALGVLSRAESCELLRQHRPELDDADADALAAELGDLPLALHLAGRFLAVPRKRLTVARYLEELRSPRLFDRLPLREQDGTLPTGHNRDVARSFALSYERLDLAASEDALALKLLARAAHLVPGEVVPTALLLATLEVPDDDIDAELVAEAALDRLVALGLIERESDDRLRMHRLVGAYVRQVSTDTEAQEAVEHVVIREADSMVDAPTLAPLTAFLPVLRGITDAALGRDDARAADLCLWLGRHLERLGSYALAQPYAARALAIRERVLGPDHPDTAASLGNLAYLYRAQGNDDAARPRYERALDICERVLGPEHPDTATSLNNLASLHQAQGNDDAARPLLERALDIRERMLGPEHPDTATSLNNLAYLHQTQGNYDAARPRYERALAIRERVLGITHPQTNSSLINLAKLYQMQGGLTQATADTFVQVFYEELGQGKSLDKAIAASRIAMHMVPGAIDWSLPVVYQGSGPVEVTTWYTRLADRVEAWMRELVAVRTMRGMFIAWGLLLLSIGLIRLLINPASIRLDRDALHAPLAVWFGVGLLGPGIIPLAQRSLRKRTDFAPGMRRATVYAQWIGAYIGYSLGGLLGLYFWASLWSLGVLALLPTALAHGLFIAVILVALGFSYLSSRAQWRSALVIATVDPTLYSLATIALIAFAALVILSIPIILVFFLSASGMPWIFLPELAAMLLAAGLISMTLAFSGQRRSVTMSGSDARVSTYSRMFKDKS